MPVAADAPLTRPQRETLLEAVASLSQSYMFVLDLSGRFIFVSASILRDYGVTEEELLGNTLCAIGVSPAAAESTLETICAIAAGADGSSGEAESDLRGAKRTFQYAMSPVYDAQGAVTSVAFSTLDVTDWRRAEETLRLAHEGLEDILDSITDGLYVLDRDFRFVYMNDSAEQYLSPRKDLIGRRFQDAFPDRIHLAGFKGLEVAMESRRSSLSIIYQPTMKKWFEVRYYPTRSGVTVNFRDITHAKQSDDAVKQLAAIIRSTPDAIIAKAIDGTILSWNRGAEKLYGYTSEEAVNKHVSLLVPEGYANDLEQIMGRLRHNETIENHETLRRRKDGTFVHVSLTIAPIVNESGEVIGASTIARDISDRIAAEQQLRESALALQQSEERLRFSVVGAGVGTWHYDLRTSELMWSQKTYELFGIPLDQPVTLDLFYSAIHPDDRSRTTVAVQRAIELGTPLEVEFCAVRPGGNTLWISSKGNVHYDKDGNPITFEGIVQDIDARKRAESALSENEERMRLALSAAHMYTWSIELTGDSQAQTDDPDTILAHLMTADPTAGPIGSIHEAYRRAVIDILRVAVEQRSEFSTEYRILVGRDTRWYASRGQVQTSGDGKTERMIGVALDITDRKVAEQDLAAALEREHNIAATLQRSLLQMPPSDAFPGIAVTTMYEAASTDMEVGGDFMDAFALEGGRVALVVGDVSGKGLSAAARTAEIKYTLRAYLRESTSPQRAMERLNGFLADGLALENTLTAGFVCLMLAIYDPATGQTEFTVGGSEPPLIIKPDGTVYEVDAHGMPLGVMVGADYEAVSATLDKGDMILMVTDGITESRRNGNFFGMDGLKRIAQQTYSLGSLRQMATTFLEAARSFGGGVLTDDACLLLAKRQ
ncbi:MAG TPA: PAS domain S-box protein [Capsulimonadaceae bacterium]